jgi:hypothetical protein
MTYQVVQPGQLGAHTFYKVLLYGYPGSSKTWGASSAPNPLVLATEPNALGTLEHTLNTVYQHQRSGVVHAQNMDTVRAVLKDAANGELRKQGYESLVIDGITDIQRLLKQDLFPNVDNISLQDWGEWTEKMRRFNRWVRDIKMHTVVTALAESYLEESTGKRHLQLMFEGRKLPNEVPSLYNLVGYCFKRTTVGRPQTGAAWADTPTEPPPTQEPQDDGEGTKRKGAAKKKAEPAAEQKSPTTNVEYMVAFDAPDGVLCKGCYPVQGVVPCDVADWFRQLSERSRQAQAQGAA